MFPAGFDYQRASTLDEAIELLDREGNHKLLAGGHSLIPLLKLRLANPTKLIDISRISELRGISSDGGSLRIGALTTHSELVTSSVLKDSCSLLPKVARTIADPAVRNCGTIGGNVAHGDPASDLPAALVLLGARVYLRGPEGARTVSAADFFIGLLETDIRQREVLIAIELARSTAGSAYIKLEHPASGYAVCGAAAEVTLDAEGRCSTCRLAYNGISETPLQASAVGEALVGSSLDAATVENALGAHLRVDEPLTDLHASGEYRVQLAKIYGRRAILEAAANAAA